MTELVVRPTGLIDPKVTIKPLKGQIDDLIEECRKRADKKERILVTTLTKRTAEELTDYLRGIAINVQYLHSEIDAIERVEILRSLRKGEFDVLVGINLLREGLDLPEVSLVAIFDADKEGFLRSPRSLIQTMGRAARNVNGRVIMYADRVTAAMKHAMDETTRRRIVQGRYNLDHGITPTTVVRAVMNINPASGTIDYLNVPKLSREAQASGGADVDVDERLAAMRLEMFAAAENLEFERAARLRDELKKLEALAGVQAGTGTDGVAFDPYAGGGRRRGGVRGKGTAKAAPAKNGRKYKAR
ncbi:MAG TPA: helicase-related protein [Polyangiaceae bacterium]|nr:helicase-related protein [Polyangiaceae bacterium]